MRTNPPSISAMTASLDSPPRRVDELRAAARECGVIWAGMFALGIGFGVIVVDHGFSWWLAPVISFAMFAGSVEFILVGMLATSAPIASIAMTTFLINARHLFYGFSFPLHRVRTRLGRAYSIFGLCDEAYAILSTKDPQKLTSGRMLWTQAGMHLSWAGGSLAGAVVGATLLHDVQGLDFVLTALFVVLTMDAYRTNPDLVALAVAGAAALGALLLAPGSMLVVAMCSFTAILLLRFHTRRGHDHA